MLPVVLAPGRGCPPQRRLSSDYHRLPSHTLPISLNSLLTIHSLINMTARTETRRSRFNLWIPTKVASEKHPASPPNSGSSESPSDSGGSRQRRKRIRVRISRSGSRILSLLGLRGSRSEWLCPYLGSNSLSMNHRQQGVNYGHRLL